LVDSYLNRFGLVVGMDVWVVDARPAHQGEYAEYLFQGKDGIVYGPVRVPARRLYVSRKSLYEHEAEGLRQRLAQAFPHCAPEIKPYSPLKRKVWLETMTAPENELVWREFEPILKRVTIGERLAGELGWPVPVAVIDDKLAAALKDQRALHDVLASVWQERLVLMIEHGATLGDCIRWLKYGAKKKVLQYAGERRGQLERLPDGVFVPETRIVPLAESLEKKIKADRCWQDAQNGALNSIVYADAPRFRAATPDETRAYRERVLAHAGAFDMEVMDWWDEQKATIYAVSAVTENHGNRIFGLFPIENEHVESFGSTAQYVLCRNESDLLAQTSMLLRQLKGRVTHNGFAYDYCVADKRPGRFLISADNAPPRSRMFRRGQMDEHGRKTSTDAVDLDTVWMSKAYLRGLSNDHTLVSLAHVTNSFFRLGLHFEKLLSYQDLDRIVEQARKGDRKAMQKGMVYSLGDSVASHRVGMTYLPILMNIAEKAGIGYFDAFHETPKNIALIVGDRLHWNGKSEPRDHQDYQSYYQEREKSVLNHLLDKTLGFNRCKPGVHEDVLVAYHPLWRAVEGLIKERANGLLELAKNAKHPVEAYMYNQVVDGFVWEMIADLAFSRDTTAFDGIIKGKYGHQKDALRAFVTQGFAEHVRRAFDRVRVLNRYSNLFFVHGLSEEEAWRQGFVPLGVADRIVNVNKGRVLHRMHGEVLSAGIAMPGRKMRAQHPGMDRMSALEIMALHDSVQAYFSDGIDAARHIIHCLAELVQEGTLNAALYAFTVRQNEPLEDRDDKQQRTRKAMIERKFHLEPGWRVSVGIALGKDDTEDYVEYDPSTQRYKADFLPHRKLYHDEIFGPDSRVQEFLNSIELIPKHAQKTLF
jgi:hypothetical protein